MGINPFLSARLLMFWGGLQNGFWAYSHNPVEYAKAIKCPTLLLYGEADNRVSREEIDEIYKSLAGKKQLVTYPLSGHEDYLWKYHDKWVGDVTGFLKSSTQKE
jgi:pimeloyl-ACP methyl ester carboxylesterase